MSLKPGKTGDADAISKIAREKEIGQHIGYRYDVNLVPDYERITPFLRKYMEVMGWQDLNWLEDIHLGYEEGRAAVFDRNINGWVTMPQNIEMPEDLAALTMEASAMAMVPLAGTQFTVGRPDMTRY